MAVTWKKREKMFLFNMSFVKISLGFIGTYAEGQ
jgi:hypothetical protein